MLTSRPTKWRETMTVKHDCAQCPHLRAKHFCELKRAAAARSTMLAPFGPAWRPYCPVAVGKRDYCAALAMHISRLRWKPSILLNVGVQRAGPTGCEGSREGNHDG
jgi:hypothetical protein